MVTVMMNDANEPIKLNELDKLAKLLASENITIQHSNTPTASFDTEKRILRLPMWKDMSKTLYHMLTLHEVGHALYTDPVAWKATILENPKIKGILNVLEDARIERLTKVKYPGSRFDFRVGYKQLFDKNFFGLADKDIGSMSFGDRMNIHYKLGEHITVPFSDAEQVIIGESDTLITFDQVVALAKRLLADQDNKPQPKAKDNKSDGDDSDKNDDQQDASDASGDQQDASGDQKDDGDQQDASDASGDQQDASDQKDASDASDDQQDDGDQKDDSNDGVGSLDVTTSDALDNNIANQLVANNQYSPNYITLDTNIPLQDFIVPYEKVFELQHAANRSIDTKGYSELVKKNQRMVDYLSGEFERKKAADTYSRTQEAKTGSLDFKRLHAYKLTTDLFKRNAITPTGKSHGLVLFVDFSSSMTSNMKGTIEQLMGLVMFCRKVNIPHTVYGFTTGYRVNTESVSNNTVDRLNRVANDAMLSPATDMRLIELFSHRMKMNQFREMTNILYTSYISGYAYAPFVLNMTPLNSAAILAQVILPKFKKETNSQVVTAVFLTDGEVAADYSIHRKHNTSNSYSSSLGPTILQNPITKKNIWIPTFDQHLTGHLMNMLRTDGYNTISYRIGSLREVKYILRVANTISSSYVTRIKSDAYDIGAVKKAFRSQGFVTLSNFEGYNQYHFLKNDALTVDSDDFEFTVADDATKSQIARSFIKARQERSNTRPLLSSFVDGIVNNKPTKNMSIAA